MAYNEKLGERISARLQDQPNIVENVIEMNSCRTMDFNKLAKASKKKKKN